MKTSSSRAPRKPLDRVKAKNYVILNQLACPGLGTILAGYPGGYLQLLLAVIGFLLFCGWLLWFIVTVLRTLDYPESGHWHWPVLCWGAVLFGGAWGWSLFSSLAILKRSDHH
jgi:hypothetical protein